VKIELMKKSMKSICATIRAEISEMYTDRFMARHGYWRVLS
jgi:hypothetical protein